MTIVKSYHFMIRFPAKDRDFLCPEKGVNMTYVTLAILMVRILMAFNNRGPDIPVADDTIRSIRRVYHPAEYELRIHD